MNRKLSSVVFLHMWCMFPKAERGVSLLLQGIESDCSSSKIDCCGVPRGGLRVHVH